MRLLKLSLKNMVVSRKRTITLVSFIIMISFILVVSNAVILTAQQNMQQAIRNALSGEVQIRPITSTETDLFPMGEIWSEVPYLKASEVKLLEEILTYQVKPEAYTPCIRGGGRLVSENGETTAMLMGMDLSQSAYKQTLVLGHGRYAQKDYEIVLSYAQASKLEVELGEWVTIMIVDREDTLKGENFKVVGIGDIQILSQFGFETIYLDIDKMRYLSGFRNHEATDFFIYCPEEETKNLHQHLQEKFMSEPMAKDHFKVTTWKEMGGFVNAIMLMIMIMLYVFIGIFIVIVGVLILNIVTIVVTERRQEIGTLRAMGYSRMQVIWVFIGEMLGVAIGASIVGCSLGLGINHYLSQKSINVSPPMDYIFGSSFRLVFRYEQCVPVFTMMIVFTLLTSIIPCIKATRERPVEILRG